MDGLNDTDLENLTKQVITLDELYGVDMDETLRGVNALMTQFGLDAQTAMDYIVTGTQNGLDKTAEMGDTLCGVHGSHSRMRATAPKNISSCSTTAWTAGPITWIRSTTP